MEIQGNRGRSNASLEGMSHLAFTCSFLIDVVCTVSLFQNSTLLGLLRALLE